MAASLISTFNKSTDISNLAAVKDVQGVVTWSIATTVGAGEPTVTGGTSNSVECLKFGSSKSVYFKPVVFSTDYFKDVHVTKVVVNLVNNGAKEGTFTAKQGSVTIGSESKNFGNTAWVALTATGTEGQGGTLELTYSVEQAFYISSIEVTYIGTEPNISASEVAIDFGERNVYYTAQCTGTATFEVTSENLTSDIELALSDDNIFSVDMTTITANQSEPETVTVSFGVSTAGNYSADLTLTSGSIVVTIPLSVTAVNVEPETYTKVTDASVLKAGDKLIIVEETNAIVATPMGSNTYFKLAELTDYDFSAGTVNISNEGAVVLTLGGAAGAWTLTSEEGQLTANSSGKFTKDGDGTWTIAIADGNAAIASGDLTIKYNSSSPRIVCYSSGQTPVQLYRVAGTATAISNTEVSNKAVKRLENGMIVIEKNGAKYNVLGEFGHLANRVPRGTRKGYL